MCMYVFHMSRTINTYYFRIQHNRLIFEMEAQYVYCKIETELLNTVQTNNRLPREITNIL
jgi:hypothetical protein